MNLKLPPEILPVDLKACVTRYNFSCNLPHSGVARQVASSLQRVACPLYCLSHNFTELQQLHRVSWSHTMQFFFSLSQSWKKNPFQVAEDMLYTLQPRAATCK